VINFASIYHNPKDIKVKVDNINWLSRNISLIRFDLIHPEYGSNKWFKLKYNIKRALDEKKSTVISFGGAYSNHLYSLAAMCRDAKIKAVGVVRGQEHYADNYLLQNCKRAGMELLYLSKTEYNNRYSDSFTDFIRTKYNNAYIIPDGGENYEGLKGASEMSKFIPEHCKHLFIACGTFTTLSGMLSSLPASIRVWAVPALKAEPWALDSIKKNLELIGADHSALKQCNILFDYHFGGFAKSDNQLELFKNSVNQKLGLNLDQVYGAKLFYAIHHQVTLGHIGSDENISIVMCGHPLTSNTN
jgi:1-aminocyclopropane-1-carboxylate deaminase